MLKIPMTNYFKVPAFNTLFKHFLKINQTRLHVQLCLKSFELMS